MAIISKFSNINAYNRICKIELVYVHSQLQLKPFDILALLVHNLCCIPRCILGQSMKFGPSHFTQQGGQLVSCMIGTLILDLDMYSIHTAAVNALFKDQQNNDKPNWPTPLSYSAQYSLVTCVLATLLYVRPICVAYEEVHHL